MSKYYEEKKRDYKRLKELCDHEHVYDFCGAWCNNDVLDSMMENPTKKNAGQHYSSLITRYFETGFGQNPYDNKPDLLKDPIRLALERFKAENEAFSGSQSGDDVARQWMRENATRLKDLRRG